MKEKSKRHSAGTQKAEGIGACIAIHRLRKRRKKNIIDISDIRVSFKEFRML